MAAGYGPRDRGPDLVNRLRVHKGGSEFSTGEGSAEDVAIEIPDDRTLKVTLENPTPFFLRLTALPAYLPQNQEFVERQGERYAQSTEALLYNGPYILTDLAPPQGATFAKNEDYWDKEYVDIERVEGKVVKDVSTAVNLHEAGELDVTELSTEYVNGYEGSPAFEPMVMFATNYLDMNQDSPTFCNENIRKAMQVGFDRDALADKILNDGSVGAEGFVPPGGILEARESKRSARPPARSWDGSTRSGPGRSTSRASRRSARSRTLRCWSGTIAGSGTSGPSCSPSSRKSSGPKSR